MMTSTLSDALSDLGFDDEDITAILSAVHRPTITACYECQCYHGSSVPDRRSVCTLADRHLPVDTGPPAWCPLRSKPVLLEVTT